MAVMLNGANSEARDPRIVGRVDGAKALSNMSILPPKSAAWEIAAAVAGEGGPL
jgi:hypothetical protein